MPRPTKNKNPSPTTGKTHRPVNKQDLPGSWASLTAAELRVAAWARSGLENKQIAAKLNISTRTVGSHLRGIYRKLRIHSRIDLILWDRNQKGGDPGVTRLRLMEEILKLPEQERLRLIQDVSAVRPPGAVGPCNRYEVRNLLNAGEGIPSNSR